MHAFIAKLKRKLRTTKRKIGLFFPRLKYCRRIMTEIQTIDYIQETGCSIARYGDGEFGEMFGNGIGFQPYDPDLAAALKEVMSVNSNKLLICIPHSLISTRGYKKKAADFWEKYAQSNGARIFAMIDSLSRPHYKFGDTQTTRPYMDWKSKNTADAVFPRLKKLWLNRDIIIVEGTHTRFGVGNDLLSEASSVKRILCPAVGAFSVREKIVSAVISIYHGELVLLALGPTATVLTNDLTNHGIQALDIGHLDVEYVWYQQGASEKSPIPGKYVNEIPEGRDQVSVCQDEAYLKQVILQLST